MHSFGDNITTLHTFTWPMAEYYWHHMDTLFHVGWNLKVARTTA